MPVSASGLHYERSGTPGAPPLVLSSGLGGSASYWAPNLAALAPHFQLILYDHRGTGRSARHLPETVSVDDMGVDILSLLDELDIPSAHIMGHAAGGVAGLAAALKAPARISSLIVVNGWAKADPHFLRCFETRLALLHGSGLNAFLRAQPLFLYPANWISENLAWLDEEAEHQRQNFPGVETTEKRIAALAAFDISGRLSDISCPVLALAAADDMLVPSKASQTLAAGLPRGTLHLLDRGGHACNVTEPEAFHHIILDWLRQLPAQQE